MLNWFWCLKFLKNSQIVCVFGLFEVMIFYIELLTAVMPKSDKILGMAAALYSIWKNRNERLTKKLIHVYCDCCIRNEILQIEYICKKVRKKHEQIKEQISMDIFTDDMGIFGNNRARGCQ